MLPITDYFNPVIVGIIGALATNVIYFEYRFYKEKRLDFLKMQIDELLLPLFIKMKYLENEMDYNSAIGNFQSWEKLLENDVDIKKIAIEKLNLANPKLSKLLLDFMSYRYLDIDPTVSMESGVVTDNFLELKHEVINEYEKKVNEYQYMNPWWKFW